MRVIVLEIPDDPAELPGWLERQLVGLDLAALVAELEAAYGPEPATPAGGAETLESLLPGERRGLVLERGLSALPLDVLRRLLRRPRLLLELQAEVLSSGGVHWRELAEASEDLRPAVERGRMHLAEITRPVARDRRERPAASHPRRPAPWQRHPWLVGLAAAAALVAIVVAFEESRRREQVAAALAASGWGWNRPGALPQDLPPAAYLDRLADAAEEWSRERPVEPVALARRLAEFREGCSVLILSEHRPLSTEDRNWLVERCRSWASKLDAHLTAVEAGEDPAKVRAEADETVNRLAATLRERAKERA